MSQMAFAEAGQGNVGSAFAIFEGLPSAKHEPGELGWIELNRAQLFGIVGDCAAAVDHIEHALRLGLAHVFIHRRYGFMNCRDYPAFEEIAAPRG